MTTMSTPNPTDDTTLPSTPPSDDLSVPQHPASDFVFPPHHNFPPFFTLQPNLTTQTRQLGLWSSLIQSYCSHNKTFKLSLSSASTSPLFQNAKIRRSLDILSIRRILDFMASPEGDHRAEWVEATKTDKNENKNVAWVWWRRPEEWAERIYAWVDETGQKGAVLTVYELRESDAVAKQEWIGMDEDALRRCLEVLVRRGKAQIFGQADGAGVKFF